MPSVPIVARSSLARALRTTFRSRCPCCGQGPLFRGWLAMHEHCPACGARYEPDAGSFLGPMAIVYFVAAAAVVAVGLGIWLRHGTLPPGAEWWLALVGLAVVLVVYRPAKAFWIWLMAAIGEVAPDNDADRPRP